jgi:hypothetical protein
MLPVWRRFWSFCRARKRWAAGFILSLAAVSAASAQELLLLGGQTHVGSAREETYGWGVEYAHTLGEHAYLTLSWLNEGHVPDHHRDGHAAQIWGRVNVLDRRLSLAAGIGPYRYFDTVPAAQGARYEDDHGWGLIYSLAATWYTQSRWLFQVRANHIKAAGSFDSTAVLFGVGYQLEAPQGRGPLTRASVRSDVKTGNEVALFVGRSILNSLESEDAMAWAFEYRRGLFPYIDWTIGWLQEGDNHALRRNGVTSQLWLVRPFLDDKLTLGVGVGPYVAVDRYSHPQTGGESPDRIAGLVTLTGSYRFGSRLFARVSWNRIVTEYSRDSDVILVGGGIRF